MPAPGPQPVSVPATEPPRPHPPVPAGVRGVARVGLMSSLCEGAPVLSPLELFSCQARFWADIIATTSQMSILRLHHNRAHRGLEHHLQRSFTLFSLSFPVIL